MNLYMASLTSVIKYLDDILRELRTRPKENPARIYPALRDESRVSYQVISTGRYNNNTPPTWNSLTFDFDAMGISIPPGAWIHAIEIGHYSLESATNVPLNHQQIPFQVVGKVTLADVFSCLGPLVYVDPGIPLSYPGITGALAVASGTRHEFAVGELLFPSNMKFLSCSVPPGFNITTANYDSVTTFTVTYAFKT